MADCRRTQSRVHQRSPDLVPETPIGPDIFYCIPVAPGIIASEHCFLYGPLMGHGGQALWLWDGDNVTNVYTFVSWHH
jgi:hypothetical protein